MSKIADKIDVAILAHQFEGLGLAQALREEPYNAKVNVDLVISQTEESDIIGKLQGMDVTVVSENYGDLETAVLTVSRIRQIKPNIGIVGVSYQPPSNDSDSPHQRRALEFFNAGANAYLSIKGDDSLDHLTEAIFVANTGGMYLTNISQRGILTNVSHLGISRVTEDLIIDGLSEQGPGELTNQQRNILRLILRGYSTQEIQGELTISEGTLNYHSKIMYERIGMTGGGPPSKRRDLLARVMDIVTNESLSPNYSSDSRPDNYQGFEYDPDKNPNLVKIDGEDRSLSVPAGELLGYFFRNRDMVLVRKQLIQDIWSDKRGTGSFDVYMKELRQTLQPDDLGPQFILPIRGRSYRFTIQNENLYPPRIEYNPDSGDVINEGIQTRLSGKPKGIMDFLYANLNKEVGSRLIVDSVWDENQPTSTLKSPLSVLNKALARNSLKPSPLHYGQAESYMLRG